MPVMFLLKYDDTFVPSSPDWHDEQIMRHVNRKARQLYDHEWCTRHHESLGSKTHKQLCEYINTYTNT